MAGYKFKLQNILNLRENIEKDKMNQLAIAVQRLEQEKSKLEQINNEAIDLDNKINSQMSHGLEVNELKVLKGYAEYYKKSVSNQKLKIKMAQDYLNVCRQELIEAAKAKKMMEKLKVIDYKKYLYEEQKIEEKLVDDLVTFKEGNKA